ncbi:cation:proton antiporter regulatory subunit [Halobium salinum]|uniref:Cation:proton antiporter regulatory subunit n=1 Tax=Halobium salinum TaxID=1364940 RepID=A0ABD5PG38_9EURY|nr:TrkA C-terminal domain-containing protein [Halobium salinum]
MTVYESDLPGVGKKHEIELDDGSRLVVVTHNTGKREVFRREDPDADSEKLFELPDSMARQVGTILEGAYFQPVRTDLMETVLEGDTVLEWVGIDDDDPIAGKTLAESGVRQRTGATVIAIQRSGEAITNPGADTRVEPGDTLIVIGSREQCQDFESEVSGD